MKKRYGFFTFFFFVFTAILNSQNYIYTERTDLRRYDNSKYVGLVSREVSAFICPSLKEDYSLYNGNFFIKQQTKRAANDVNKGINDNIDSVFKIYKDGKFEMLEDNGYPSLRNFPSITKNDFVKGDSWSSYSQRAVDPLEKGLFTKIPLYVQYTYTNDLIFHNEECMELHAVWATRYGNTAPSVYFDPEGDSELEKALGKHDAKIYLSKKTGYALLVSDRVDETFFYKDGKSVNFKGTISIFTEYPPAINEDEINPYLQELAEENIAYEKTEKGRRLSIQNLQFEPDSAKLLRGEEERINKIANLLKKLPAKTQFLIEGHTARVGSEEGEYELSLERAYAIAGALIQKGIAAERIICKGYGGALPLASNENEEGRAKNRRVEITILE